MSDAETDAAVAARALMLGASMATLATAAWDRDGWPFASLVQIALDTRGAPLLLLSDLAEHSRNIAADDRISLLIDGTSSLKEPLAGPRLTLLGRARKSTEPDHRRCYLARHPSAAQYVDFADFAVYHMAVDSAHLVAGFGAIDWISAEVLLDQPKES